MIVLAFVCGVAVGVLMTLCGVWLWMTQPANEEWNGYP
jgi:hypothetical protein